MNAPVVRELGISLSGGGPRHRLAALIVLGIEMGYRRRALGYEGGGSWQAHRDQVKSGERQRWEDYCKAEAGITETMVRHYLECADAVRTRITLMTKASNGKGARVLKLMEIQPSLLPEKKRGKLIEGILQYLYDTDTQSGLRGEFKARMTDEPLNLPSPQELIEESEKRRNGLNLIEGAKGHDPAAATFRRNIVQMYLRMKRDEETRSMARVLGISEETMRSVENITNIRRVLEAARAEGKASYSAAELYELAQRKGIMP